MESFDQIFLLISSGIVDHLKQETLEQMLPKYEIDLPFAAKQSEEAKSVVFDLMS